jgi:hypothetical protein
MPLKAHNRMDGGNAAVLEVRTGGETPEIAFAAHPHGGPECLWFYFRIVETAPATTPPEKLRLVLRFADTMLGCGVASSLRPVYRPEGKGWFRASAGIEHLRPDGRRDVSWVIPYPAPSIEVAFCYPYGEEELGLLLRKSHDYWQSDAIGLTQEGRTMVRLSNDYGAAEGRMAGVYLIARQHSGETPGSWVLDGFLERIARDKKKPCLIWAVPFANADGVVCGDYGKDSFPYDLNRAWGRPPMRHETLVLQQDMRAWARRCKPRLALDLHAPGGSECEGVYAYLPDPAAHPDAHKEALTWAHVMAETLGKEFAAPEFGRVAHYASRWETPHFTHFARSETSACAMAIETPYALCGQTVMTQNQYREVGRLLAKAVLARLASK